MSVNALLSPVEYSLDVIKHEVLHLVQKGIISRRQPMYVLCEYIQLEIGRRLSENWKNTSTTCAIALPIFSIANAGKMIKRMAKD